MISFSFIFTTHMTDPVVFLGWIDNKTGPRDDHKGG